MDDELLRKEAVRLAIATNGGIGYNALMEMPIDEYESVVEEAVRVLRMMKEATSGNG